jgi:hypothetical protein
MNLCSRNSKVYHCLRLRCYLTNSRHHWASQLNTIEQVAERIPIIGEQVGCFCSVLSTLFRCITRFHYGVTFKYKDEFRYFWRTINYTRIGSGNFNLAQQYWNGIRRLKCFYSSVFSSCKHYFQTPVKFFARRKVSSTKELFSFEHLSACLS